MINFAPLTKAIMLKTILKSTLIASFGAILFSCGSGGTKQEVVNVYTHRHYEADQKLFDMFSEKTGIKVNVVSASADELIQKLELEGANSPADVLITVDAGRLHRAEEKNLLQSVNSEILNANIPAKFRDPEGFWFGLTYRARIIAYSKERVNPEELSSYEALTEPQWKGRVLTRSSENIYNQSLMASIIAHHGQEGAEKWAAGLLANMARSPKGSDRDQVKAVASGEGDVAIVNTYYIGIMLNDSNEEERKAADKIAIFFPNQADRGTHINISGAAVTKYAPNKENAIKLIEFLSNEEAQGFLANINFEYPVNPKVEFSDLLKNWGSFKADELNLSVLGDNNNDAVMIFDKVGWK
jgi:iron(III) transport system substrate-binding protein